MEGSRTAGIVLVVGIILAGVLPSAPARDLYFQARQAYLYYRAMEGSRIETSLIGRAALSLVLANAEARRRRCPATAPSS